jgi:hypothetical protein
MMDKDQVLATDVASSLLPCLLLFEWCHLGQTRMYVDCNKELIEYHLDLRFLQSLKEHLWNIRHEGIQLDKGQSPHPYHKHSPFAHFSGGFKELLSQTPNC